MGTQNHLHSCTAKYAGPLPENDISYNPAVLHGNEYEQRNALLRAGDYMNDGDLVLVSDLDEIPDPAIFKK
ncbi:MAG: hypothetical protein IPO42_10680 [Chitinophagaceae bacterium]|nr:hypothetical protein [Chitinophagaceae bacterium]